MPFGVGRYCFIHSKGNARASYKDKANSVPTSFYFITAYRREQVRRISQQIGEHKGANMKTYLLDILNRYKKFSESLDVEAILCSKSWSVFNDSGCKEIYLFQHDGSLIISVSGEVTNATWKYIPVNQSILISTKSASYMLHPAFVDDIIFALQLDGTNQYSFMIDELQRDTFAPKSLSDIEKYFITKKQLELEKEKQLLAQRAYDKIVARERQEQQRKQEAEEALIEEALRESKLYQTVLSIAWIQMFLIPIILIPCYLFSDEFNNNGWKDRISLIMVLAFLGVLLFVIISFFILDPIKNRIIKRIKENNIHNS